MNSESKSLELAALEEAIMAIGGQTKLAAAIGKKQGHISVWLARGRCAPDAVLAIEAVTGISRHLLRPDVFGPAPHVNEADGLREGDGVARAVSRDDHQDKPAGVAA